ncbi:MAG: Hsp20/alpha crystallin family protein [Marinirhabdus sp.]
MKLIANNNTDWFPSLFNDMLLGNRLDAHLPGLGTFGTPSANISENTSSFVIEMSVPGFKKEDFTVEIEENTLKFTANKQIEKTEEGKEDRANFTRKEFEIKNLNRSFTLPETVRAENIAATYKNGIMTLTLPKKEAKPVLKKMVEIS